MNSCIYEGRVRHRRHHPVLHEFEYPVFMMYLDLEEIPYLFNRYWLWSGKRLALAWFRRKDYFGNPGKDLAECVRERVVEETGSRPEGAIRLLTHLRYFGFCFNPVSFYYCFNNFGFCFNPVSFYYCFNKDGSLHSILAEITNTPWNERKAYVLDMGHAEAFHKLKRFTFKKAFHVSPFMPMDIQYDWKFSLPNDRLLVQMKNMGEHNMIFDAMLSMKKVEINKSTLRHTLVKYSPMTLKVIFRIYYQALKLWWKKVPFYSHPNKQEASTHSTKLL
jgi:DUF1365 family protein